MNSKLSNSTVLVVGGAGFIGSNFVKLLLDKGHSVVVFDNLSYAANLEFIKSLRAHASFNFVNGDIRSTTAVTEAFHKFKPQFIVNFAAETHVDRALEFPLLFTDVNINGTLNLLECYRKFLIKQMRPTKGKFIQISTDEVYGVRYQLEPADENDEIRPNNVYSVSKAASENLAHVYRKTHDLPIVTTRCCNNFGLGQHSEKFIAKAIKCLLDGKKIPIYGNGNQIRQWIHVSDHCEGIYVLMNKDLNHDVYNIGADVYLTNNELINVICNEFDKLQNNRVGKSLLSIEHVDDRPGHDTAYSIDYSRLTKETNWLPKRDFSTAISDLIKNEMMNYLREH